MTFYGKKQRVSNEKSISGVVYGFWEALVLPRRVIYHMPSKGA